MNFLFPLEISASALSVQRRRMDVISSNLANIETTRTEAGGPYRRKVVVVGRKEPARSFEEMYQSKIAGVAVEAITEDPSPFRKIYHPSHPDADEMGYLLKPNVDLLVETTNMLMARRAFEANVTAIKTTRQMVLKALEIGK